MTREEYNAEMQKIKDEYTVLGNRETSIRKQYIAENAKIAIGERVKVTTPSFTHIGRTIPEKIEYGYVKSIGISHSGDIDYKLVKEKKDGTPSHQTLYYGYNSIITKV